MTARQRCHRVDRLCRELVSELRKNSYHDRKFKPAKAMADETLGAIRKVCSDVVPPVRHNWAYSKKGSKKRKKRRR